MINLTLRSATELLAAMRAGHLTASTVLEAHIARILAVNPTINAVADERFAEARREAADPRPGPLAGLPVTIKEAFNVAGMPATCGLTSRAGHVATTDATAVARLRAAGAIIVATTITPDNCWAQETQTLLKGRVNNPWARTRSVGGSTGGEAALIAAGGSPLGLGSDIAGSIRLPAAFCGIAGLRPTSAALPEAGFYPASHGRLADLNAIGPLARRVEDLALAWDVLRGATPQPPDTDSLRGERVAHWFDDGLLPSSPAVMAGVEAATAALVAAGMRPVAGAPEGRRLATLAWAVLQGRAERHAIAESFGNGIAWSPGAELLRALVGRARVSGPALASWLTTHYGPTLNVLLRVKGARRRKELRAQMRQLVGTGGVAVCPIFPTTAPPHHWSYLNLLTASYQTWVNLAGLPGLTVPVGFSGRGMPVAVQLVGAPGAEATLLAAGMAVQQALMPTWHGPRL